MSLYKNNTRQHFTAVGLGGEAVGCGGWLLEYGRIRPRFVGVVGVGGKRRWILVLIGGSTWHLV